MTNVVPYAISAILAIRLLPLQRWHECLSTGVLTFSDTTLTKGISMRNNEDTAPVWFWLLAILIIILILMAIIALPMWLLPKYSVYRMTMQGKAKLMAAEQEKQILVEQAKAEVEAAKLRSEAIKLVGEMAAKYPEYRTQEFIGAFAEALREGNIDQMVYVPTECNIPVVEGRSRGRQLQAEK